ncbi:hypothetical protein TTHERM_001555989 (macronuclear) [Tetrahymena thermophila SB210]|uniref:Uncharacterized protein n=1 Tax=Tetrahymena thermophila (strain SB210) TaxID=312017 RepID=W7XFL6_TETTS|nr:hypothetical protein TTHERM_001555989 [Tetrahymena thermophila SB210]EWS75633.1 hypothetical protein TTHERM_001555989 [Tetrahymena thermophila SB210]|eukprot:XP_012651832.1 hypothetical protein TTHERM_001555989 [Tetrahymena thermophila SB210]
MQIRNKDKTMYINIGKREEGVELLKFIIILVQQFIKFFQQGIMQNNFFCQNYPYYKTILTQKTLIKQCPNTQFCIIITLISLIQQVDVVQKYFQFNCKQINKQKVIDQQISNIFTLYF